MATSPTVRSNTASGVSSSDRTYLRDMARRVAEIAADPVQEQRELLWKQHNDLQTDRPLVLAFPEGSWEELAKGAGYASRTEADYTRQWEWYLFTRRYYWEHIRDDSVTYAVLPVPIVVYNTGWGIACRTTESGLHKGARAFESVVESVEDIEKIRMPEITVDWEETERRVEQASELFGDILTVRTVCPHPTQIAPLDTLIHWRGIENLFMDLITNPAMVHAAVSRIVDGCIRMIRSLERQGALSLNNRGEYVGSGGFGFTDQLPQPGFDGRQVRTQDLWGAATAQIFSEISPEMHEEFALQHERRYLELFGLNCYGCCEPLHLKLDALFRNIPRLRRISISPWADIALSAEKLGRNYVYSWKPNPVMVSSPDFDPAYIRAATDEFLRKTRGSITEIVMKDTHTVHNHPERFGEWVRITREAVEEQCGK